MHHNAICRPGTGSAPRHPTWYGCAIFDLPRKRRSDEVERVPCWPRARRVIQPSALIGRSGMTFINSVDRIAVGFQ